MKINIAKKQINGYNHIYALNGFSLPSTQKCLYKYMQFERFVSSVNNKELVFVSPETWKDPFERRFFKTDFSAKGYTRPEIACMCLTSKSSTNEEASWKMYVNPNDKALRLSVKFDQFCQILDDYAQTNNCEVYIGKVIYNFTKDEITSLHRKKSKSYHDLFFPPQFSLEHYLSLMLIKRVSFTFENEVRIFIVRNSGLQLTNGLLKIPGVNYSKTLIPQIVIAPHEPLPDNDIRSPFRTKINNIESQEYKTLISSFFGCKVLQSQLYSSCIPVGKV